jgi:hypothetical protein
MYVMDWEMFENAIHPSLLKPQRIKAGEVLPNKLASGRFRFPVKERVLNENYITHLYTDIDNTHKEFRVASRRQVKEDEDQIAPQGEMKEDAVDSEEVRFRKPTLSPQPQPSSQDFWTVPNYETLMRFHFELRDELFIPTTANCPSPLKWLDILRDIKTDT